MNLPVIRQMFSGFRFYRIRDFGLSLLLLGWTNTVLAQPGLLPSSAPGLPGVSDGAIAWVDYDNDGDPDLLLCGRDANGDPYTELLRNDSTSFPVDSSQSLQPLLLPAADWADYDNDGDPDLILTGDKGGGQPFTQLYRNDAGTLTAVSTVLPALMAGSANWADFDRDGDYDLLLTGYSRGEGYLGLVARNDGNNSFAIYRDSLLFPGWSPGVAVGDYDGDTLPDIVISGVRDDASAGTRVIHNEGNFQFSQAGELGPGFEFGSNSMADLDGDGDFDFLSCGETSPLKTEVFSFQYGQFQNRNVGLPGLAYGASAWGDFDGDGDPDIAVAGRGYAGDFTCVYRNDNGTFIPVATPSAMPRLYFAHLAWGDWNQDGFLDYAVCGQDKDDLPHTYIVTYIPAQQIFEP